MTYNVAVYDTDDFFAIEDPGISCIWFHDISITRLTVLLDLVQHEEGLDMAIFPILEGK